MTELKDGFYAGKKLWNIIQQLSEMELPEKVAVAFVGKGVEFSWNNSDVLVVALSKKNVSEGLVNPNYLETLFIKGIKVYKVENLHAKIYSNDFGVVVSSCNLSHRSQEEYVEAGIFSQDANIKDDIDDFFQNTISVENIVSLSEIQEFKPLFNIKCHNLSKETTAIIERIWIINLVTTGLLQSVKSLLDKDKQGVKANLPTGHIDYTYHVASPSDYHKDDIVIVNHNSTIHKPYRFMQLSEIEHNLYQIHLIHRPGVSPIPLDEFRNPYLMNIFRKGTHEIKEEKYEFIKLLRDEFYE